jgi:hypothetical protein
MLRSLSPVSEVDDVSEWILLVTMDRSSISGSKRLMSPQHSALPTFLKAEDWLHALPFFPRRAGRAAGSIYLTFCKGPCLRITKDLSRLYVSIHQMICVSIPALRRKSPSTLAVDVMSNEPRKSNLRRELKQTYGEWRAEEKDCVTTGANVERVPCLRTCILSTKARYCNMTHHVISKSNDKVMNQYS